MTPVEQANAMVADSRWRWETDPSNALGHVAVRAADARWGTSVALPDLARSRFWVEVGQELVRLAANPNVTLGEVMTNLAIEFHVL